MTQENNERLNNALNALYASEEFKALKDLVIELKETDGKGGYNAIFPHIERNIDYWLKQRVGFMTLWKVSQNEV